MSEEQFVYEGRGEYEKHLIFDEKDEAITAMKEEISLLRGEVGEERAKRVRLLDTLREKVCHMSGSVQWQCGLWADKHSQSHDG